MAFRVYPPGTINPSGPVMEQPEGYHHNWLVHLLPYMEEVSTYRHIDFSVGVYDEKNAEVRKVHLDVHRCPSDPTIWSPRSGEDFTYTSYAGSHNDVDAPIDEDNNGMFFLNKAVHHEDITDGASHTIFIGEKLTLIESDLGWMSGTRSTLRNTGLAINYHDTARGRGMSRDQALAAAASTWVTGGFGSYHPGGSQFALGDGSVRFLSETTDQSLLQQLGHRADGQLMSQDW
jgi:hypothetical protein